MTQKIDLKSLREKAEAATPGPWANEYACEVITIVEQDLEIPFPTICGTSFRDNQELGDHQNDKNAEFIASANPQAILSLLDAIESMRDALEKNKNQWHDPSIGCLSECKISCEALAKFNERFDV